MITTTQALSFSFFPPFSTTVVCVWSTVLLEFPNHLKEFPNLPTPMGLTQRTNIANYLPVVKSAAAGVCSMYQWCKIRGVTKNVEIESMYTPEVKERTLQHTDYTLYTGFMGRFSATY